MSCAGGGKSGVLSDVLASLDVPRAIVDCVACATPRALYETCLNQLHDHRPCEANNYSSWCSCENPAQFVQGVREVAQERGRVCLVFDRAERLQPQEKLLSTLLLFAIALDCRGFDEKFRGTKYGDRDVAAAHTLLDALSGDAFGERSVDGLRVRALPESCRLGGAATMKHLSDALSAARFDVAGLVNDPVEPVIALLLALFAWM